MPFDVPMGFRSVAAADYCLAVTDGTHDSPKGVPNGKLLITSKNVKGGRVQKTGAYTISSTDYEEIARRSRVDRWDIIFTMIGTVGELALVDEPAPDFAIKNVGLFKPRDELSAKWLYYYLNSPLAKQELTRRKKGSTQQYVSLGDLRSFPVLEPIAGEYKAAAVSLLSSLDDRIELLHQTNATLESIAQALFKSWFIDFDPVRAKAEGREPEGMDAATAALFPSEFEESELGLIPKGWSMRPFGALLASAIGGDWGSDERDEEHDQLVTVIRGTDMPDIRVGKYNGVRRRFVGHKKLAKRALVDGDIVIEVSGGSKTQPTGRSLYLTCELLTRLGGRVVPTSFCRLFRAPDAHTGLLLAQHLSSIYGAGKTWNYQVQSTGLSNFQTQHFLSAELVTCPPPAVRAAFFEIVQPLVNRRHSAPIEELEQVRDTLLPRLISGKLRITEAMEQVEEALT